MEKREKEEEKDKKEEGTAEPPATAPATAEAPAAAKNPPEFSPAEIHRRLSALAEQYPFVRLVTLGRSLCGLPLEALFVGGDLSALMPARASNRAPGHTPEHTPDHAPGHAPDHAPGHAPNGASVYTPDRAPALSGGKNVLLLSGGHHGSEAITSLLLLAFAEEYCHAAGAGFRRWGLSLREFLERRTLVIFPLVNPDGCFLAATGRLPDENERLAWEEESEALWPATSAAINTATSVAAGAAINTATSAATSAAANTATSVAAGAAASTTANTATGGAAGTITGGAAKKVPADRPMTPVSVREGGAIPDEETLIAMNGGSGDFSHWQANARGVDLNHNFDYRFSAYRAFCADRGRWLSPGPTRYAGASPQSEPESRALGQLVEALLPRLSVSLAFHTQGEVIYYHRSPMTRAGAAVMARLTGYRALPLDDMPEEERESRAWWEANTRANTRDEDEANTRANARDVDKANTRVKILTKTREEDETNAQAAVAGAFFSARRDPDAIGAKDPGGYGGFTDWLSTRGVPAYTVECGKGKNPLPLASLGYLYASLRPLFFRLPLIF